MNNDAKLSIRIPSKLKELMEKNAVKDGQSVTQFVIDAVWFYLMNRKQD